RRNGQRTDISSSYLDLHRKTRGKAAAPQQSPTAPDWQAARPAPSRSSTESPRRRKRTFLPEHTAARPESRRPCPLSSSRRLLMGFRFRGPSAHESFMLLESRKSAIQTVTL